MSFRAAAFAVRNLYCQATPSLWASSKGCERKGADFVLKLMAAQRFLRQNQAFGMTELERRDQSRQQSRSRRDLVQQNRLVRCMGSLADSSEAI